MAWVGEGRQVSENGAGRSSSKGCRREPSPPFPLWTLFYLLSGHGPPRAGRAGGTGSVCAFWVRRATQQSSLFVVCGLRGIPQRKGAGPTRAEVQRQQVSRPLSSLPRISRGGWGRCGASPLILVSPSSFVSHLTPTSRFFSKWAAFLFLYIVGLYISVFTSGQIKLCSRASDGLCVPPTPLQ